MQQRREERARAIQASIGLVLLHDWDPIGIQDVPEAQDEYDSYVAGIYRLLVSGATEAEIGEHLCHVEQDRMGLSPKRARAMTVAAKLRELDVDLGGVGAP
jgi:hypothetical protein